MDGALRSLIDGGLVNPFETQANVACTDCLDNSFHGADSPAKLIDRILVGGFTGSATAERWLTDLVSIELDGQPVETHLTDHYGVLLVMEPYMRITRALPIQSGISLRMRRLLLLGISAMAIHKLESGWAGEWEVSSFFQWAARRMGSVEEGMFYTFVVWLFVGLYSTYGALAGARSQQFLLAVFGLTFVEELHHVVEAIAAGGYYPGLLTAILYIPLGGLYWRELTRCIRDLPDTSVALPGEEPAIPDPARPSRAGMLGTLKVTR